MSSLLSLLLALLVATANCQSGDISLVSQSGRTESLTAGRLLVFLSGQWGTVCDDSFDLTDGNVACRQLGFDGAIGFDNAGSLDYPSTSRPILLDDLTCRGSESRLSDCTNRGIGSHNCTHNEDVILACVEEGNMRLVGSSSNAFPVAGRLEIFYNGEWGTVCADGFTQVNVQVVCSQLGFADSGGFTLTTISAISSTPIWLDDVSCRTSDLTLLSCNHTFIGVHNCTHSNDVAVYCGDSVPPTVPPAPGPIRLVSETGRTSSLTGGRLEVFLNSQWGTVCDNGFGSNDASVACRQLGFADGPSDFSNAGAATFTQGTGSILLNELSCTGSESSLGICLHSGIGRHNCGHSEDVILSCTGEGSVRLVDSSSSSLTINYPSSGRLEVYSGGRWGTVCDDSFTTTNAEVVCSQLGFSPSGSSWGLVSGSSFPSAFSSTSILLDDVSCSSTDLTILSCSHNPFDNCGHSEDVAIYCNGATGIPSSTPVNVSPIIGSLISGCVFLVFLCIPMCICIYVANSSSGRARRRRRRRGQRNTPSSNMRAPATITTTTTTTTTSGGAAAAYPAAYPLHQGHLNSSSSSPPHLGRIQFRGPPLIHTLASLTTGPQQAPSTHPALQQHQEQKNHPSSILQDQPPPSYEDAIAYPPPTSYPRERDVYHTSTRA